METITFEEALEILGIPEFDKGMLVKERATNLPHIGIVCLDCKNTLCRDESHDRKQVDIGIHKK